MCCAASPRAAPSVARPCGSASPAWSRTRPRIGWARAVLASHLTASHGPNREGGAIRFYSFRGFLPKSPSWSSRAMSSGSWMIWGCKPRASRRPSGRSWRCRTRSKLDVHSPGSPNCKTTRLLRSKARRTESASSRSRLDRGALDPRVSSWSASSSAGRRPWRRCSVSLD